MFELFSDGPRTWKWAVPYFFCLLFGFLGMSLTGGAETSEGWRLFGMFLLLCALLAFVIGASNHRWWANDRNAEVRLKLREADAITPRGYMLLQAKGVHPDVLRMVLGEQARRWGIVSGTKSPNGKPYSVLMSRPRVTDAFLAYFLRMSNDQTYMPKRKLSDKDHSFDPQRIVTAYEMYDDLESLLVEEMKATRPLGENKPGYWLGEWTPQLVGMDFGMEISEWEVDEPVEEEPAERIARGGSSSSASDIVAKALGDLQQTEQMRRKTAGMLGK